MRTGTASRSAAEIPIDPVLLAESRAHNADRDGPHGEPYAVANAGEHRGRM